MPSPSPSGAPSVGCVEGWRIPAVDSPLWREPLELILGQMGVTGTLQVDEMRYFEGPEVPWILEPRPPFVRRWYVKGSLLEDPSFRGRWIVERRSEEVAGIAAVAPYETGGYRSPDWSGFFGEGPPRAYPGLPGRWPGIRYDFVTGEGDTGFPGLPAENAACLEGT